MADLYDLLEKIHQKPGLYIGVPSVSNLHMFLCGYNYARQEQNLPLTPQEKAFDQFQSWVQQRFKITASVSWAKIIALHAADERVGFELFFDLLATFRQEHFDQVDESTNKRFKDKQS